MDDGWFFPLIILPVIYVLLIEMKSLNWLGFTRHKIQLSVIIGTSIAIVLIVVHYPIFLRYLPNIIAQKFPDLYGILLDVVWYPVYEEITYRSFFLTHFSEFNESWFTNRNLIVNLVQSVLFLVIHKHHFGIPLVLISVFLLTFLNGLLFLRTRNIFGCIFSHSLLNSAALLLMYANMTVK